MERKGVVYFSEGLSGERPAIRAAVGDRSRGFTDFARAVRWTERRAERVRVLIDGLGLLEGWPDRREERERIEAYVRRRLERFDREYRERRSDPVDWFYAVKDPDEPSHREIGGGRRSPYSYVVSHGGDTIFGLAEYEEETLAEASTWR